MTLRCILILILMGTTYALQVQKIVIERQLSFKDPLAKNEYFWYSSVPPLPILFAESPFLQDGACKNQTDRFLRELRKGTLWAVKMFDASVKYPDGIIPGHRQEFGNFDECYYLHADIPPEENDSNISEIRGRYCQVEFYYRIYPKYFQLLHDYLGNLVQDKGDFLQEPANYVRLALCVPSTCTAKDVETSLKRPLEKLAATMNIKLRVAVPSYFSQTVTEAPRFSTGATCYCAVVLVLIGLVITATSCDILHSAKKSSQGSSTVNFLTWFATRRNIRNIVNTSETQANLRIVTTLRILLTIDSVNTKSSERSSAHNFLMCFSARKNIRSIFRTSETEANLGGVNMLRILFTIGVISFSSSLRWMVHYKENAERHETAALHRFFTITQIGFLSTDGLFTLAGILQAYSFMKNERAGKSPTFISGLIFRYLRFLPCYAAVLFFVVYVFPTIDTGPLWKIVEYECNLCAGYWWANLLYIHNYVYADHYCMLHTWSMSVQFQAWILTFFLMKVLQKLPVDLHPFFLWLVCFISCCLRASETLENPVTLLIAVSTNNLRLSNDYHNGWLRTHLRCNSYLVGIIQGVFIHDYQYYGWRMSKRVSRIIFTLGVTFPTLSMLWMYLTTYKNKPLTELQSEFTISNGTLFAMCVSYVVTVLTVGQGLDNVRSCLTPSWAGPLAKLMYSAYMSHFVLAMHAMAVSTTHDKPTFYNMFPYQLRDVFCSLWIALFIMLTFHMPAMNIYKVLSKSKRDDAKRMPIKSKEE